VSIQIIPDAEALIGAWLREHADLEALGARVAGRTPNSTTMPWIRVTQLDATPITRARTEHVIDYMIQLDCYAGKQATDDFTGQAEASTLARTARAVLKALEGTVADGVTVSRVRFTTHLRAPDMDMEPARERYVLTAEILMHP
jgi:hypothetical protein